MTMSTLPRPTVPPSSLVSPESSTSRKRANAGAYVALGTILSIGLLLLLTATLLAASVGARHASAASAHAAPMGQTGMGMGPASVVSNHVTLTIVAQRPGSSVQGPAYTPMTSLTFPAHSLVTITIVNQDAGDTDLPANSPYAKVSGITGGMAYVDGRAYSALDVAKVAHTFTIPQLGVNVPIPGDTPQGKHAITVTFSFKTGAAGMYMWQCMDPCGAGASGWGGPMATMGYMQGMVMVQ
ncbi:MAG: hypothetical protein ABI068_03890 [Ktedonobacterales bacterium]